MDDILLNKSASLERCIQRIHEEYTNPSDLFNNFTKQDAIILNIIRACEISIDMAAHMVRIKKLGLPQNTREAFLLLEKAKIISHSLSKKMQAMVGFRNVAVHEYSILNLDIVKAIIEKGLMDISEFSKTLLKTVT